MKDFVLTFCFNIGASHDVLVLRLPYLKKAVKLSQDEELYWKQELNEDLLNRMSLTGQFGGLNISGGELEQIEDQDLESEE